MPLRAANTGRRAAGDYSKGRRILYQNNDFVKPALPTSSAPSRTLINPNATPRELWDYKQFVCWRYVDRGRPKPDKVPVNARTLRNAGAIWPNTWTDIRTAVASYKANQWLAGIGFVLTERDPYVMLDLDNCIVNGQLSPFASEIVDRLDTYTEYSPSLTGLRLLVYCPEQPPALKRLELEAYSKERFATLTGDVLHQRPIAHIDSLKWLYERFSFQDECKPANKTHSFSSYGTPAPSDDAKLWRRIFNHNPLAEPLYNGDMSVIREEDGRSPNSRAALLLLNCLALWTKGDAARMRRMMEQTALDKSKWHEKRGGWDWLEGRINDAINYMAAKGR